MIQTGYSFKSAFGHLPDVIKRIGEIGWTVAPLADLNSTFAYVRWTNLAKGSNLRPVYGVRLSVVPELGARLPITDYWTFLAKDHLSSVHKLIKQATSNPGEPCLTYAQAHAAEGVWKISGPRVLLDHVLADDPSYCFGFSVATAPGLLRAAMERRLNICAAQCNDYCLPEDRELYRITLHKNANTQSYPQHIVSDGEWLRHARSILGEFVDPNFLLNREHIFRASTATLSKATLLVPERDKTLEELCHEGAVAFGVDLTNPTYGERLGRELTLIREKGFEDYFYIVGDAVRWARERMCVGPARGSSAGSLVCFLLGITAIDPLPHGLLFERFVDVTRSDLPDIDVDFSDVNRAQVFTYLEQKYGVDRVARLGTVGMLGPKSIFRILGPALRLPQWQINKVMDSMIDRSGGDTRANQQVEDTLKDTEAGRNLMREYPEVAIAGRMENHPSNASQHAAGVVLTQEPIVNYVAVDTRTRAAMCDKKDAQELNLLKIDALGLKQLSIFEGTLRRIGQPPASVHRFLESLPLDDPAAYEVLNKKHFAGVFQFLGVTLQALVKQMTVENFNDIVSITALARPGPMATGGSASWAKRRAGREPVTYPHDLLRPYLEETLGIVTYQEQVMKIGRELGDLSWKDVTALRKGMSQSLGQEYFDQFGVKWKEGAIGKGVPSELVDRIWFDLCAFGSWGFNKSHAVAYALVSYWCCWLKAHHPLEFAAATLDAEDDPVRQIATLRELSMEGVNYVAVDATRSTDKWEVGRDDSVPADEGRNILIGPLNNIKGVGPATVQEILSARRRGEPLRATVAKKLERAKTDIDSLFPIRDKVRELYPDLGALNIVSEPLPVDQVQPGIRGSVMIIGVLRKLNLRDENEDVNVARRGGKKVTGPDKSLILFFRDDTDEIFCKVSRYDFHKLGGHILERGKAGKAIYAVKGFVPPDFRMIRVRGIKYLGDLAEVQENVQVPSVRRQDTSDGEQMAVNDAADV